MTKQHVSLEELQARWKEIYQTLLPEAARSNSPAQPRWSVSLDHCFARIILDHTVGINAPWPSKIKSPAYKNMSTEQLEASISLGRKILKGNADLVDLDNRSLGMRGKRQKEETTAAGKRKRDGDEVTELPSTPVRKQKKGEVVKSTDTSVQEERQGSVELASTTEREIKEEIIELSETPERRAFTTPRLPEDSDAPKERSRYFTTPAAPKPAAAGGTGEDVTPYLKKIALSRKTPFQKKVLSLLCQIPRGKYTTYGALSNHLSSCPRAIGSAIRNNPFAPQVPCHRVLATGGGIGGFHGSWGRNGKAGLNDDKKRKLLRDEGVRFDGTGKVVGAAWEGFK